LETQLHLKLPRDEGFETLGGFVPARLDRIPKVGDSLEFEGRRFTVVEMDEHRVARVKVETLKAKEPAEGKGSARPVPERQAKA